MVTTTAFKAKWIEFIDVSDSKKITKTFDVLNTDSQHRIGVIKWYGAFRQYAYFPNSNTVYERQCLSDITQFIQQLMDERKAAKKPA